MNQKMTAAVAVTRLESALEAVKYLYENQTGLVYGDVQATAAIKREDFTDAKNVKASETIRGRHERLVKGLEKAVESAKRIAAVEAKFMKDTSIPAEAVHGPDLITAQ